MMTTMKQRATCEVHDIKTSPELAKLIEHAISISRRRRTRAEFVRDAITYAVYCLECEVNSLDLPTE